MAAMGQLSSAKYIVAALLVIMAALMLRPLRDESATIDEPITLAAGYLYLNGYGHQFNPEHPPLGQMLPALPLLALDVNFPEFLERLGRLELGASQARPWRGWEVGTAAAYYPGGRASWYYWPYWESGILGQELLYGGWNDPDPLLWWARAVEVLITLVTGLVIALWLWRRAGPAAAVFGTMLWVFNPLALAYGHLVITDMGVTLGVTVAVAALVWFLNRPCWRTAIAAGAALGLALMMKFSAALLAPLALLLVVAHWWCRRDEFHKAQGFWVWLPLVALSAWVVVLLAYAPDWRPAPALTAAAAARAGVPGWFQHLRPVLIPAPFFKGIALQAAHSAHGHEAFLAGEWRSQGWWYYFPLALLWKLPIPLLLLALAALGRWLGRARRWTLAEAAPGITALGWLGLAMTSSINIGVRYLLPVMPLVAVGITEQWAQLRCRSRIAGWLLVGLLAVVTICAYPFYLEYFNALGGGTRYGYRYLVDSNYDWGQDAKRLQAWSAAHGNPPVLLRFFGVARAIQHYGINCQAAAPDMARTATNGTLVISASALMKPEWRWLDDQGPPAARIGQTLFVYDLPVPAPPRATVTGPPPAPNR